MNIGLSIVYNTGCINEWAYRPNDRIYVDYIAYPYLIYLKYSWFR